MWTCMVIDPIKFAMYHYKMDTLYIFKMFCLGERTLRKQLHPGSSFHIIKQRSNTVSTPGISSSSRQRNKNYMVADTYKLWKKTLGPDTTYPKAPLLLCPTKSVHAVAAICHTHVTCTHR